MKKITLFLFAITITFKLFSQNQYATTTSGQNVILKPNGTWEYAKIITSKKENSNNQYKPNKKQNSSSRTYITGPRGGCYYVNRNGNKTYIDRSYCR